MTCSICNKPTDIFNPYTLCVSCKKPVCAKCADTRDTQLERLWHTGNIVCKNCEVKKKAMVKFTHDELMIINFLAWKQECNPKVVFPSEYHKAKPKETDISIPLRSILEKSNKAISDLECCPHCGK
jgi:hypothetical protein